MSHELFQDTPSADAFFFYTLQIYLLYLRISLEQAFSYKTTGKMASELLSNVTSKSRDGITEGSCLCGSIKYRIMGAPSTTVLCHCISCKKASGSLFQANGFYEDSVCVFSVLLFDCRNKTKISPRIPNHVDQQLQITSSSLTLKTYTDHSPDAGGYVERSFCSNCGCPMFTRNPKWKDAVIVLVGNLDYDTALEGWEPESEFYCKRKTSWLKDVEVKEDRKFNGMS